MEKELKKTNIFRLIFKKICKYRLQLIISLSLTLLITIISYILITNLYRILLSFNEETLATIFYQLKTADVNSPILINIIIYFLITYKIFKIDYSKKYILKLIIVIFIYLIVTILLTIITLMLTKVNGMLFIDILVSLLKNMDGLGL